AFCICNRENVQTMQAFFTAVKEKQGSAVSTKAFMSDDAAAFINAWVAVMSEPEKRLLCSWHVDKIWRLNLKKVQGGKENQTLVYKAIRMLLEEADVEKFTELQTQLVQ